MWRVGLLAFGVVALAASGCAKLTLAWADLDAGGPPAWPPVFATKAPTLAQWEEVEKPKLRTAFEEFVYGVMPEESETHILDRKVLNEAAFGGKGRLEEFTIQATATFGGVSVTTRNARAGEGFLLEVLTPNQAPGPVPVIIMETFCPRWDTIPDPAVTRPVDAGDRGAFLSGVETFVFGRYICTPPVEAILDAGYAIATIYPGEIIPDSAQTGLEELRRLAAGHSDDETRWGAIGAWAWAFSRIVDVLETDERIDPAGFITWGHSRYAKSALVAAAYDLRISAVIAHQSGTGGASLNRAKRGESLKSITASYPHWFSKRYAGFAGREGDMPIDQHQLLALIAPRPVLLGNARRDVWSDPAGSFRAARAANPAYALYGASGLEQERLKPFDPEANVAFWIRPGTHGVVKEDWPAFLQFLDAHFKHDQAPAAVLAR